MIAHVRVRGGAVGNKGRVETRLCPNWSEGAAKRVLAMRHDPVSCLKEGALEGGWW
jgi:hypothetical protein